MQITHISKRTLYKYYGSRESFLLAIIRHDGDRWREWFLDAIREQADQPLKRLFAFFEILADWSSSPSFTGCLFAQVLNNPPFFSEAIRREAKQQMAFIHRFIQNHLQKAGVSNAPAFAEMLLLPTILLLSGGGNQVCDMPGLRLMEIAKVLLQDNIQPEEV